MKLVLYGTQSRYLISIVITMVRGARPCSDLLYSAVVNLANDTQSTVRLLQQCGVLKRVMLCHRRHSMTLQVRQSRIDQLIW